MNLWRDDYDEDDLRPMAYDFTRSNDLGFTPAPVPCAAASGWYPTNCDKGQDDPRDHAEDDWFAPEGCLSSAVCWIVAIVALLALVAFVCGVGEPSLKAMDQERSRTVTVGMETQR